MSPTGTGTSAGTTHLTFTLKNGAPKPCTLEGFPTVAFYGASGAGGAGAGAKLPLSDVEIGGPATPVTLDAGGAAQFVLSVSGVPVNGAGCSTVASLEVTPPGSTESLSVPDSFQACGTTVGVEPVASP